MRKQRTARKKKEPKIWKLESKIFFLTVCFAAVFCVLFLRVGFIKLVHGEEYEAAAKNQQVNRYDITDAANRGSIMDRNNQTLAISTAVYNIALDPRVLAEEAAKEAKQEEKTEEDPSALDRAKSFVKNMMPKKEKSGKKEEPSVSEPERTLTTLCEYFPDLNYEEMEHYITIDPETDKPYADTHWKYVKKGVERSVKEKLEKEKLVGVAFEQDSRRTYPLNELACHLIGFMRGELAWGLEKSYDEDMTGIPGRSFILYQGNDKMVYQDHAAQDGSTLMTTLDYTIQESAEKAVKEASEQWPAKNVGAIVMDPNTGEILAMASDDSFDLNHPDDPPELEADEDFRTRWEKMSDEEKQKYLDKMWRNFCISDSYEPGSVFKPIVVAAALEEGVITPNTHFNCSGSIRVRDRNIRCHQRSGHGNLNIEEIMAQSCNPGMVQIVDKLGKEKFYEYQKSFGFGQKTGIDLPGEFGAEGLLHSLSGIGPVELATMSFGQTFNCTSIQMVTAFAALINGGELLKPYVVSQVVDADGEVIKENNKETVRRVISDRTSDYIKTALKATVDHGTAKQIQIPGYSIGCKTGTSEQGSRSNGEKWTLSHLSYFPAENPQYLVFCVINEPEDYMDGAQSTAPMTKKIMEDIIQYKNLEPTDIGSKDKEAALGKHITMPDYVGSSTFDVTMDLAGKGLTYKVVGTGNTITNQVPKAGAMVTAGTQAILYVKPSEDDSGKLKVPDVSGMTYAEATKVLNQAGFAIGYYGDLSGTIVSQKPPYGVSADKGIQVVVKLVKK